MKPRMREGDKWGRLECTRLIVSHEIETADDGAGGVYETGNSWDELKYELQCECGRVVVVRDQEFHGKRAMKDCGCGMGAKDGRSMSRAFTVPQVLSEQLDAYANEHTNGNVSMALAVVLRRGFEAGEKGQKAELSL